jgi:hypothetical protein
MKRTGEPHIWEEEITDYHSILVDTLHYSIRLIEDHKSVSGKTRTETLKKWEFDHEPTIGDFGEVMAEMPGIIGIEL